MTGKFGFLRDTAALDPEVHRQKQRLFNQSLERLRNDIELETQIQHEIMELEQMQKSTGIVTEKSLDQIKGEILSFNDGLKVKCL